MSCSTPSISPRRLISTATEAPSASRHIRSTGPMAVGYSRRTRVRPSASVAGCSASSSWRCFSTPSFCSPGSTPSSWRGVVVDLLDQDPQRVAVLAGHRPLDRAVLGGALAQGARRRHPVERLVGAAVGVHQHRAVGLDHQHPGRHREVGGQPAGVVDLAAEPRRVSRGVNLQRALKDGRRAVRRPGGSARPRPRRPRDRSCSRR